MGGRRQKGTDMKTLILIISILLIGCTTVQESGNVTKIKTVRHTITEGSKGETPKSGYGSSVLLSPSCYDLGGVYKWNSPNTTGQYDCVKIK